MVPIANQFVPFLQRFLKHVTVDVAYAVTSSQSTSSAFPTIDDDTRGGVPFTLDGNTRNHAFFPSVPGTIALSTSAKVLDALHEFSHASSSSTNGFVDDLYVDTLAANRAFGVNYKDRALATDAIPNVFATYNGTTMLSDQSRDGLGYGRGWVSYHCELLDASVPAMMDNYNLQPMGRSSNECQHDRITRQFLVDRITAKLSRT